MCRHLHHLEDPQWHSRNLQPVHTFLPVLCLCAYHAHLISTLMGWGTCYGSAPSPRSPSRSPEWVHSASWLALRPWQHHHLLRGDSSLGVGGSLAHEHDGGCTPQKSV